MKNVQLTINVTDEECAELVSWIANRIIILEERKVVLTINGRIILDQISSDSTNENEEIDTKKYHTGYSLDD